MAITRETEGPRVRAKANLINQLCLCTFVWLSNRCGCTGFAATSARSTMHTEQSSLISSIANEKHHVQWMHETSALQRIGWLRLVISIPSHKIKWRWLIGWLRCPCSVHVLSMFSTTTGGERGDERWPLHRFARWSIFYSSCRANFLLLPNLSSKPSDRVIFIANIKRGDWWLINFFPMICMRCVCCHLQKSLHYVSTTNNLFENSELSRWSDFTWMARCSFARWLVEIHISERGLAHSVHLRRSK